MTNVEEQTLALVEQYESEDVYSLIDKNVRDKYGYKK